MYRVQRRAALLTGLALALLCAGTALALQAPGRSNVRSGTVQTVALNASSLAYVVGRSKADCDHVELWNVDLRGTWRFGRPGPCTNLGSTGTGISSVGVSGNRAVWIHYTGGNLRDWQLMTATTTQRLPRQLRFVEQDVSLPSPFTIGDSTARLGIPYAAGHQVVLLGTNGKAVFKHNDGARITAVAAGRGPGGALVAALRETGDVVMLRADGTVAWTVSYPAGAVTAISLAPRGLIVQTGGSVEIRKPTGAPVTVSLPAGGRMTDYAEGRILYTLGAEVHARAVGSGADTVLLRGVAAAPPPATLDTHGLGWGRLRTVNFACGGCIRYAP